jgi:hypothetical protein
VRAKKFGWLAYAVALTFAVVAGEVSRGTMPGPVALASWILTAALLVALWSYALQRPVGSERYWRIVFWIVLGATLLMLAPVLMQGGKLALFTAALTLAVVPAYVAAYRYAYRSSDLWSSTA